MAYSPYSGGSNSASPPMQASPAAYGQPSPSGYGHQQSPLPYVKAEPTRVMMGAPRLLILEQPQERFRFRYESELGGTHGQLAGRSGSDRRSFPTVKLEGYAGKATIRCELYTVSDGQKNPVPHVHTLQGRFCSNGIAEITVDAPDFTASFQGLGIIHTAKKAMVEKIMQRKLNEKIAGPGWVHSEQDRRQAMQEATIESQEINMNRVCLRFRALVQNPTTLQCADVCDPVYSDPIYNGKSAQTGELKIVQLSEAYSPCTGNKEIWLLTERVRKTDIKVRFFEEDQENREIWHSYGKISKCHHQYAIILQTPPYRNPDLRGTQRVFIQLERPSDGCVSEAKHFQYTERDQRATKRVMTIHSEQADHKRMRQVQMPSGDQFSFQTPQPTDIMQVFTDLRNNHYADLMSLAGQQTAFSQQQAQAFQQQQQQQQPGQAMPVHTEHSSPSAQMYSGVPTAVTTAYSPVSAFSPHGSSTMSPPMSQESVYSSPPHQQQMLEPTPSVSEVLADNPQIPLTVPQMPTPRQPGPGLNTTGGQMNYGAGFMPNQLPGLAGLSGQQGALAEHATGDEPLFTSEELSQLVDMYGNEIFADGVPMHTPDPRDAAPRGGLAVRGAGGTGGASVANIDGAAGGDLAKTLEKMTLSDGGDGGKPQKEGEGKSASGVDINRPEVKLAYVDAERLYLFAATGDHRVLLEPSRCLVGMQNSDGDNPLHVAAMYGRARSMAGFLQAIAGMSAEDRDDMVNSPNGSRQTPLLIAVLTSNLDCIQLLLKAGALCHLVDNAGNSVLHLAARTGNTSVMEYLLQYLEKEGNLERLLQQTNYQGFTALHVAVSADHPAVVQQLTAAGADASAACDTEGRSPLHLAVADANYDMCGLLLKLGADVDAPTFGDLTPLHVACKMADRRLVSLLVSKGADPSRRSVELQPLAGSGTESGEDEDSEEPECADDEDEERRLDAFLYAEMSGDPQLEQILRGRVRVSPEPAAVAMTTPPDVAIATSRGAAILAEVPLQQQMAAVAKKGDGMDSGMDSGLGITAELTSTSEMTSQTESRPADCLGERAAGRLAALLDAGVWRELADLLQLDVSTLEQQRSPTAYILRCVKKYDSLSLQYLAALLESLGQLEAQNIIKDAIGQ